MVKLGSLHVSLPKVTVSKNLPMTLSEDLVYPCAQKDFGPHLSPHANIKTKLNSFQKIHNPEFL